MDVTLSCQHFVSDLIRVRQGELGELAGNAAYSYPK